MIHYGSQKKVDQEKRKTKRSSKESVERERKSKERWRKCVYVRESERDKKEVVRGKRQEARCSSQ